MTLHLVFLHSNLHLTHWNRDTVLSELMLAIKLQLFLRWDPLSHVNMFVDQCGCFFFHPFLREIEWEDQRKAGR